MNRRDPSSNRKKDHAFGQQNKQYDKTWPIDAPLNFLQSIYLVARCRETCVWAVAHAKWKRGPVHMSADSENRYDGERKKSGVRIACRWCSWNGPSTHPLVRSSVKSHFPFKFFLGLPLISDPGIYWVNFCVWAGNFPIIVFPFFGSKFNSIIYLNLDPESETLQRR